MPTTSSTTWKRQGKARKTCGWTYEVCTFLKISEKTLQRLRVSGTIAYSNIRGRYFYKVSEIRRMLEERLIRSNKENIDNLITNHQLYAKERGNLRKNK